MIGDPNIAFLDACYAEWSTGNFTRVDMFHPEIVFVTDMPEQNSYSGHEEVARAWADFMSAWGEFRVMPEKVITVGDDRYVAFVELHARGMESQVPATSEGGNIIEFRDGKISRFEILFDRERVQAAIDSNNGGTPSPSTPCLMLERPPTAAAKIYSPSVLRYIEAIGPSTID